jgi:hypothetical protein
MTTTVSNAELEALGLISPKKPFLQRWSEWRTENAFLLRQVGIAVFAIAVYTDIALLAFFASDFAISCLNTGISYILNLFHLPVWQIDGQRLIVILLATLGTIHVFQKTYRNFTLSVPAFAGVLTVNYFDGRWAKYDQGLKLRWPWETFDPKLAFSLELVTVSFEEDYTTNDGGVAIIQGSFRYAPSFKRLEKYAAVDEQSIGTALLNVAKSDLTVEVGKRSAGELRKETLTIKTIIEDKYKGIAPQEEELGIDFEDFTLADVAFSKDTQTAMSATFAATTMFAGVEKDPLAREDRMVLAGIVKRQVTQYRLDGDVRGLDNIGPALVAILERFFGKGSPRNKGKGQQNVTPTTP